MFTNIKFIAFLSFFFQTAPVYTWNETVANDLCWTVTTAAFAGTMP